MKIRLAIAALIIAATGAFTISRFAFAQTGTTGNTNNSNSNCALLDPPDNGTSTGATSGTSGSVPNTGNTQSATQAPTATATTAPAGGTTSTSTPAPAGGTAATATPAPTTAPSSGGTGSTNGTTTTGGEPPESPYCANGFHLDIAVGKGGASVTSGMSAARNSGMFNESTQGNFNNNGSSNQANGNGSGSVPVTGNSNGNGFNVSADYGFNAFDPNALSGANMITVNLNGQSAAHMEICSATGGAIYQWYTSSMWSTYFKSNGASARWVRIPSYTGANGMTCIQSWLPGVYATK